MKVVICNIRNEEYLLQWWLPQHKDKFDHGVFIDYHSTDRSRELIKDICPTWEIETSTQPEFEAFANDRQFMSIEHRVFEQNPDAWVLGLNVTETLIGDTSVLDSIQGPTQLFIPCSHMTDSPDNVGQPADPSVPLHKQRTHGVEYKAYKNGMDSLYSRGCRIFHNHPIEYTLGRHYWEENPYDKLAILWWGYSPYTPELLQRKLQIQDNIPQHNKDSRIGWEHVCDQPELDRRLAHFQTLAVDLQDYIKRFEP